MVSEQLRTESAAEIKAMHILVAEDDVHIREGLRELLSGEGYRVTTARDGTEAMQAFADESPDLLLLDIMMPGLSGYDVCRQVRSEDAVTPVIFVSARSEEIDRVLGLELGADDYIMKPFGVREVLARVKAALRRSQLPGLQPGAQQGAQSAQQPSAESSSRWEMVDLTIDVNAMRAWRGDIAIELSQRDIAILQLLNRQRGVVVGRDALYDAGWGRRYLPSSRSLDQHMSQLRRRIEQDPSNPKIIQTVHGAGYRYDG